MTAELAWPLIRWTTIETESYDAVGVFPDRLYVLIWGGAYMLEDTALRPMLVARATELRRAFLSSAERSRVKDDRG